MAARQQQQIEAQQQMLVAKEQRLKFLKQQELRHQQIASENDRLRMRVLVTHHIRHAAGSLLDLPYRTPI